MGTTNTTTGSNTSSLQFNPIAQSAYNNLVGNASGVLGGFINSPFSNPSFNLGASQSQAGAQQAGANNMGMLNQNQLAQGLTGQAGAGWMAAQKAQTGRANSAMSSQANIQNILAALQRQQSAVGTGLSFSPQLTGQSGNFNQQQSTSGLGTWLPQLMGAGMSAAMMGMGGGAGMGANAAGTGPAFAGGMGSLQSAMNLPSNAFSSFPSGIMAGMGGGLPQMMQGGGGAPSPFMSGMFSQGYNQ